MASYLRNVLVAFDRYVNALTGGDPEMTISGRMGIAAAMGRCRVCRLLCWLLDLIDSGHCARMAIKEAGEGSDEVIKL